VPPRRSNSLLITFENIFDRLVISVRKPFINTYCICRISLLTHFLSISYFISLNTDIPLSKPLLSMVSKFNAASPSSHHSMCSLVPIMRGTGASTISWRDEGREAMNGCHQVKGWRSSLSVNSKEDGEGESKREFSWKRWRRRS
jgi:hypothetical protein